jgi:hypothetical protein
MVHDTSGIGLGTTQLTYLRLGFQCRFSIMMGKRLHHCLIIVCRSSKELPAHLWRPENLLPLIRVRIDVLSKQPEWFGLGLPEPATYTQVVRKGVTMERKKRKEKGHEKDIPTKHEPGWKCT